MVEFSKIESDIFNLSFGRLNMTDELIDNLIIKQKIKQLNLDFIRLKIRNPNTKQIHQLHDLCKQVHLVEILRVYVYNIFYPFSINDASKQELFYKKVDKDDINELIFIIKNTYTDIPFGNYTSPYILNFFPVDKQLNNFIEYYKIELLKPLTNKIAFIIYNESNESIGCIISEVINDSSYTYYVGVLEKHRNRNVLTQTIKFIKTIVEQSNLKSGFGAARLSNIYSQKAFEKNNMDFIGYDFVYLLEI